MTQPIFGRQWQPPAPFHRTLAFTSQTAAPFPLSQVACKTADTVIIGRMRGLNHSLRHFYAGLSSTGRCSAKGRTSPCQTAGSMKSC
jgi:hypothetical protein